MQDKLGDNLKFNAPQSEVTFLYEDESTNITGKYVVNMNKKRPSWFPKKLLNKPGS